MAALRHRVFKTTPEGFDGWRDTKGAGNGPLKELPILTDPGKLIT